LEVSNNPWIAGDSNLYPQHQKWSVTISVTLYFKKREGDVMEKVSRNRKRTRSSKKENRKSKVCGTAKLYQNVYNARNAPVSMADVYIFFGIRPFDYDRGICPGYYLE
jgi:hypothetical protein